MTDPILTLNVAGLDYADQLTAAGLQGLVNRLKPRLYLDWGRYDDVTSRTTNEVFIEDDLWVEKYQEFLGYQDRENQAFYEEQYHLIFAAIDSLSTAINYFKPHLNGLVIWDPENLDTVNLAIMLAGLEDLLILSPEQFDTWDSLGLELRHDLRGRWEDRLSLYRWVLKDLQPRCKPGFVACVEPGWRRPEFVDYLVHNRIFTYSLGTGGAPGLSRVGQSLLLLLTAGPFKLRNLIYNFRLEGLLRGMGVMLLGWGNPEARLATRIQRHVKAETFPTIFGWHTLREDEFSFMLHLSANGLRLIPSHMAGNFSFHSMVPCEDAFSQTHLSEEDVAFEEDKVYLTVTFSDGDQLLLMNTRQVGNWARPDRGEVPFNWEVQPCLVEMAPALYSRYYRTRKATDYLVAGPSGAGYVIPPIMRRFRRYLQETARICAQADVRVMTSYIGDPPIRIIKEHAAGTPDFIGYLAGYVHFGRHPQYLINGKPFIANQWPPLEKVAVDSDEVLAGIEGLINQSEDTPRFIAIHLFAYRTTITDIRRFVDALDPARVKVVRADEFLIAAKKYHSKQQV